MRQATEIIVIHTDARGWSISPSDRGLGRRAGHAQRAADRLLPPHLGVAADPGKCGGEVARDIEAYFARLAPESRRYDHDDEGPDDMPAHLRTALTGVQLSIPLIDASLALGTWQGIYLFEHRRRPHRRTLRSI